jgi:hypothetical protein
VIAISLLDPIPEDAATGPESEPGEEGDGDLEQASPVTTDA